MQVKSEGKTYILNAHLAREVGFGANTDIVAASLEAYVDCINKFTKI